MPQSLELIVTEKEITLVRLAQKGNTRAFNELVAIHDAHVMNLALSLLGSREDAADVYQEIFIKVFKSLKNYRFQSELSTWLYRITVNTCLSFRKSRGRKQSIFPKSIEANPDPILNRPDDDDQYEADSALLKGEMSEIIVDAIEELPPQQKAVVILRHYQDKKIREIADIMELNEGTVKGYLFRAMNSLKEKLEPYYTKY